MTDARDRDGTTQGGARQATPPWGSAGHGAVAGTPERGAPGTWDAGTESDEVRALAVERLKKKRDFRTHLFVFLTVNTVIHGIWLITSIAGGSWFYWPAFPFMGWGIGVAVHAWDTYGSPSRPIDQAAIDREIERMSRR